MILIESGHRGGTARPDAFAFLAALICSVPAFFKIPFFASGIATAFLVLLPWAAFSYRQRRLIVSDPFPLVGVVWILGVTLPALIPAFYLDRLWTEVPIWAIEDAGEWIYRSWAAASVVYWGARLFMGEVGVRAAADHVAVASEVGLRQLIGLMGFAGLLSYIVVTRASAVSFTDSAISDSSGLQVILLFSTLAVIYVYLYFQARVNDAPMGAMDHYLIFLILALELVIFMVSGSKGAAIQVAAAWGLANATSLKRPGLLREIVIAAFSVGLIIAVSHLVTAYRMEVRLQDVPLTDSIFTNLSYQFEAMRSAIQGLWEGRQYGDELHSYDTGDILDRFALSVQLAQVLDYLNGVSPYQNAFETFLTPLLAFMPRSVIEAKVQFMNSGEFAQLNGWKFGGLSLTIQGSLIWTWGFRGMVAAMAGLGLLMAWIARNAERAGQVGVIYRSILLTIALTLLNAGIEFQGLVTITVRIAVLLILVRFVNNALSKVIFEPALRHQLPPPGGR